MNKNKLFSFAILAGAVVTSLGVISTLNTNGFASAKAECGHHEVNHYVGRSNRTYAGSEGEYVDHWICCGCHTVWADEARTIVLGNSQTDRTKIDLRNTQSYKFQWDYNGTPYYSEELGVYYKNTLLGSGGFDGNGAFYVETPDAQEINPKLVSSVSFTLFNDTKFDLDIRLMDVDTVELFTRYTVVKGTSYTFELTPEQYNTASHGFEFWFTGTDSTITSDDTIRITVPKLNKKTEPRELIGQGMTASGLNWEQVPTQNGTYLLKDSYGFQYLDPRVAIPEWATLYFSFKNPTSNNAIVDFGSNYAVTGSVTVAAHDTTIYTVPANVWNAPVAGETDKIRFTVSGVSDLELNLYYAYDDTLDVFATRLNELVLPQDVETNGYISYYVNTVKPLLDEIKAKYTVVPNEIKDKFDYFNSIFFGDIENGNYASWGYGSHNSRTKEIDGIDFIELFNINTDAQQQFSVEIKNVTSYEHDFLIKIYNPTSNKVELSIYDNWDGWVIFRTVYLEPNSWNTVLVNTDSYDQGTLGLVFKKTGVSSGLISGEFLISPIISYVYECKELDNAVYGHESNDVLTGVDGGAGLPISKKLTNSYGTVYSINGIKDIQYPRVYLSGKDNTDAKQVKFYVKNETNKVLWLSSDCFNWSIEQYQHQIQLGGVGIGEWVEFTVDAEHFNYGTDMYINFGAADGSLLTGTILVSAFIKA